MYHTTTLKPPHPLRFKRSSEHLWGQRGRALTVDQLPTPGRPGAWFACWVFWGWDRPQAVNWPCFHRPHQGFNALLLCARWVCVSQAQTFLRQVLKARVHSGQRRKSYGFKTMLWLAALTRSSLVRSPLQKLWKWTDGIKTVSEGGSTIECLVISFVL